MTPGLLVTPTFFALGWCLWVRRRSWRLRWNRVLTLSVALQLAGMLLSLPMQEHWLGKALFRMTGTSHFRDYLGQVCFICSACAVIYGIACRLLPDGPTEVFFRWIEYPAAAAVALMLVFIRSSGELKAWHGHLDFFDEPCDGWLRAYWLTYVAIVVYLLGWLAFLLLAMRRDPRSQLSSDVFLAATGVGAASISLLAVKMVFCPALPTEPIWLLLAVASGLAAFASGWSWRGHWRHAALTH